MMPLSTSVIGRVNVSRIACAAAMSTSPRSACVTRRSTWYGAWYSILPGNAAMSAATAPVRSMISYGVAPDSSTSPGVQSPRLYVTSAERSTTRTQPTSAM